MDEKERTEAMMVCPAHEITKREIQTIRQEVELISEKIDVVLAMLNQFTVADEESWHDEVEDYDDDDEFWRSDEE